MWTFLRRAFCVCVAAAMPAGCGGLQAPRLVPPAQAPNAQGPFGQALKVPKGTLIYAVGDESSFIFTFPGGKLLHEIATTAYSACSDRRGNVFLTQVGSVAKYQHGATKPADTYEVAGSAYSCSVNPKTNDLAVVVFCIRVCGEELVVLRDQGRHRDRYRVEPLSSLLYCAYDNKGDLFVDGYNGTRFGLAELRKGAHRFVLVTLKKQIKYAAQIQWDGTDLAIETRENPVIYHVAISGTVGRIVGHTFLDGIGYKATQSWIGDGTIIVPSAPYLKRPFELFFYNYPAGGQPIKILKGFIRGGNHAMIDGVTLSARPSNDSP